MNATLAKFLYWNSVMADQSEMPKAAIREMGRRRLLRARIGEEAYIKWASQHEWEPSITQKSPNTNPGDNAEY